MVDDEGIARLRMRVPAFREQHVRAEEHGPAPELRQEIALDADVLHVLRVRRIGNRRNHLVEGEADGAALLRVDRQLLGRAEEIARRPAPLLAFAPIHRQFHRVAVRAAERLVAVQQRLHGVGASRDLVEAGHGVAEDRGVEDRGLPRQQSFNIHAEDLLRLDPVTDLEARLARRIGRQHQQHAPVDGLRDGRCGDGNLDAQRSGLGRHARLPASPSHSRRESKRHTREPQKPPHRCLHDGCLLQTGPAPPDAISPTTRGGTDAGCDPRGRRDRSTHRAGCPSRSAPPGR